MHEITQRAIARMIAFYTRTNRTGKAAEYKALQRTTSR